MKNSCSSILLCYPEILYHFQSAIYHPHIISEMLQSSHSLSCKYRFLQKCRGYTPWRKPAGSINRPDWMIHRLPARSWRFTGYPLGLGGSLVTRRAGQMDDEAHGPEGRFTLNGGLVYEKSTRNIPLQRKQDQDSTCNRVILILIGLVMQTAPSTYIRRGRAPQRGRKKKQS